MILRNLFSLSIGLAALLLLALAPSPATGDDQPDPFSSFLRAKGQFVSQGVLFPWYARHPEEAPPKLQPAFKAIGAAPRRTFDSQEESVNVQPLSPGLAFGRNRFNNETGSTGLPQNEESVAFCSANPNEILMGTNDLRGLLTPAENTVGWHYSNNGGSTVFKEGLQDVVLVSGADIPSLADPVVRAVASGDNSCDYYAANLAVNFDIGTSAVALYKTSSATLNGGCFGPACWPNKRVVAFDTGFNDFLDKEWMDAGPDGSGSTVVWITWTRFDAVSEHSPIEASRCPADLSICTPPIPISSPSADAQASYVTIAPDGKVYVSWIEVEELPSGEVFTIKMRVAPAGSTTFEPERTVATESQPLGFGGSLDANDSRVLTLPANTVLPLSGGGNRFYIIWAFCVQPAIPVPGVPGAIAETCRNADSKVAYTDNDGATVVTRTINRPGNQYFPSIDADTAAGRLYIVFYSNEADPWNHRQQVILGHGSPDLNDLSFFALNPAFRLGDNNCSGGDPDATDALAVLQDITGLQPLPSACPVDLNEPSADPVLGDLFIGDYIEVSAHDNLVIVGYNANFAQLGFLGTLPATHQQDNYLGKFTFP